jgi:signal transduction histidine kinase
LTGLAIAQSIAEAQGGKLTLTDRSVGGLRASVKLPV